jgi:hypothetical protein
LGQKKTGIFLSEGLDRQMGDLPVQAKVSRPLAPARKYSHWIPFFDRKNPKLSVFVLASVLILASVLGLAALPLEPARLQTGDSTVGK